jgi:hypothetical protein
VQLRSGDHYDGGAQWTQKIPATGGQTQTTFFSFEPAKWGTLLGKPGWSYAEARKTMTGLLFVGDKVNVVAFYGLRIDGFVPKCP